VAVHSKAGSSIWIFILVKCLHTAIIMTPTAMTPTTSATAGVVDRPPCRARTVLCLVSVVVPATAKDVAPATEFVATHLALGAVTIDGSVVSIQDFAHSQSELALSLSGVSQGTRQEYS